MKTSLVSVCWLLTSRCNYKCSFCFKVPNRKDITQGQAENILLQLKKEGVQKITFSGGEPLLWSGDLLKLIKQAKSLGIMTMIITNGSLLTDDRLKEFENYLDWITLSIDGSNETKQIKAGRPPGHFNNTNKLLKKIENFNFMVKINTVLSKQNSDDIVNIAKLVKRHNIIRRWKVFQFFSIRDASLINKKKHEIAEDKFRQVEKKIKEMFTNHFCKVYFGSNRDLEASYFTIAPDGIAYISKDGEDIDLGDLNKLTVKDVWDNALLVNKDKYWNRATWFIE